MNCKPRDIFQQIISQVSKLTKEEAERIEGLQENELGDFLYDQLKERTYLVVLDDLWNVEDWKFLAKVFPKESNGSRLLLTT